MFNSDSMMRRAARVADAIRSALRTNGITIAYDIVPMWEGNTG